MLLEGVIFWVVVVTALVLWLPQNAQHEGMHALVARHYGATIVRFTPYPSWLNGHFTWASVAWKGGEYTPMGRAFISIAPQAANTVLLILLITARSVYDVSYPLEAHSTGTVLGSILAGWALVNFIDGAYNLGTFYKPEPDEDRKYTDGWSFQKHMDLPVLPCRIGAAIWHLTFGALLVV